MSSFTPLCEFSRSPCFPQGLSCSEGKDVRRTNIHSLPQADPFLKSTLNRLKRSFDLLGETRVSGDISEKAHERLFRARCRMLMLGLVGF
jgi:hypothetical protein